MELSELEAELKRGEQEFEGPEWVEWVPAEQAPVGTGARTGHVGLDTSGECSGEDVNGCVEDHSACGDLGGDPEGD